MKKILILMIVNIAIFAQVLAPPTGTTDPISVADGFSLVGLRAAGMGGAHIGLAEDYTALWYNPARLAYIYRAEVSGGLNFEHSNVTNTFNGKTMETDASWTRFNQLGLILPIPTSQGGLSFAMGFQRTNTFNKLMDFQNPDGVFGTEDINGGLSRFSIGGGMQISEIAALGATFDIPFGTENYTFYYNNVPDEGDGRITRNDWTTNYTGVTGRFGVAIVPNKIVHLGLNIDLPTRYEARQEVIERTEYLTDGYSDSLWTDDYNVEPYSLSTPFKFGAGMALRFPYVIGSADVQYSDYTQTEYREVWLRDQNSLIKNSYTDVLSYRFGIEGIIPKAGMKLRAGYSHEPLHYTAYSIEKDRNYYTGGIGFLISKTLSLDIAVVMSNYETLYSNTEGDAEWREQWANTNAYFGIAYRF